jgi:hypothetical protein
MLFVSLSPSSANGHVIGGTFFLLIGSLLFLGSVGGDFKPEPCEPRPGDYGYDPERHDDQPNPEAAAQGHSRQTKARFIGRANRSAKRRAPWARCGAAMSTTAFLMLSFGFIDSIMMAMEDL